MLLRQYLKMGGQILGFNIDPNFNNAIDCMLWADLTRTEPAFIRKYMGNEGAAEFFRLHGCGKGEPKVESRLAG